METKRKQPNDLSLVRRRLGLSRKRVAQLLGIDASTVRRYESGSLVPGLHTALELQIVYCTPVSFLYRNLYELLWREIRARDPREKTLSAWKGAVR